MPWQDNARDVAVAGTAGGVLWYVFRFLVGAAVADHIADVRALRTQVEDMKEVQTRMAEKQELIYQMLIDDC